MKYHYHKLEAYLSFDNLHKHVKNLLDGFGTKYDINFKQVLNWTKNVIRYHYIIRDINKCTKNGNTARLERLQKTWNTFDGKFIKDLEQFLIYNYFYLYNFCKNILFSILFGAFII